ncbi:MAG TPA: SpoIID/LytB domain-containing protein [Pyrinomonadaceae bacterium]|nr:SpoIID/LytB domain-containing protein [Pyrinomonadaceae bacterium]
MEFPTASRVNLRRALVLSTVVVAIAITLWVVSHTRTQSVASGFDAQLDARLLQAATSALGEERGAIIVMDPQTGRIRAVVNSDIAFKQSFPPGSTLKPFTALAALRAGLINEDERTLCHEKYVRGDFHTTCSHPSDLPPFTPTEAIAYSCNYYFGKLGERLPEAELDATLKQFGFGADENIKDSGGKIVRAAWRPQSAMGEGEYLQTTPIQLLDAYVTLVNGGHSFGYGDAGYTQPINGPRVQIGDTTRETIVKGMRGAVRYGSAESANLYSLPLYVFGKTGTATQIDGFRTHGWFVGFAADADDTGTIPSPEKIKLAVLVFLYRAHGVDAAQMARPIFAEFARDGGAEMQRSLEPAVERRATQDKDPGSVRVFVGADNAVRTMSVEDYVRSVVAAEGSTETEPEALKALAIASRTYVLKNAGRHAADGYDFCTTTHCQRFAPAAAMNDDTPDRIRDAVSETAGEVLRDADNGLVDSYFSASCGGATANMSTLWGKSAPAYLRGVTDEYCESEPHHSWTDVIPANKLAQALESDPRTNVGPQVSEVKILRRDETGRAELINIDGDRHVVVNGWDFKIIVGRALGWNLLKSSRFEISRSGSNYVFRGSGFGHGLGLCQEGAHVMALRGANYRQILRKYFPSTHVSSQQPAAADLFWGASTFVSMRPRTEGVPRLSISSEDFRVSYPSTLSRGDADNLMELLVLTRRTLVDRIAAAGLRTHFPALEVFVNDSTGNFVGRTGQPGWASAATRRGTIDLQPLDLLKRKRILETTIRHELAHVVIEAVGRGRTPRWLAEGFALYLAGEGKLVEKYAPRSPLKIDEIEQKISAARSSSEMRTAYAAAYSEVKRLVGSEGEKGVWRRLAS